MNFIDKEDILAAQIGKNSGKVAGAFDGGARCCLDINADLSGNNMGQAGLAETGRAVEQYMVEGFTATGSRRNSYLQVFFNPVLSGKISQTSRPEAGIERRILRTGFSRYNTCYLPHPLTGFKI